MKFENDLLNPENKTHLRNALIDWCLGSDGQNGATCDILGNITWTTEMENVKPWANGVDEKIDNAIGARLKVDSEIITNSYKREAFLLFIDRKVERIINAYQEVIDELNQNVNEYCMVIEKFTHLDELGFAKYDVIEKFYGKSFYDCVCKTWEKYGSKTNFVFGDFVDACYRGGVHLYEKMYCKFGYTTTNN